MKQIKLNILFTMFFYFVAKSGMHPAIAAVTCKKK